MKRTWFAALLTLACLLGCAPAAQAAEYDLLPLEGQRDPAEVNSAAADCRDVPVDEDTYREEEPSEITVPRLSDGAPGRGSVEDLYQYWEETGYPAYVSYAFAAGGEVRDGTIYTYWEIGLVDAGEAERQEILDLLSPTGLATFWSCTYTHAQKLEVYDQLLAMAEEDEDIRQVVFGRNTQTIIVAVSEGLEKEYAQRLIRDEGLGAVVSVTDEGSIAGDQTAICGSGWDGGAELGLADDLPRQTSALLQDAAGTALLWPFAAGAIAAVSGALLLLRNRQTLRQTADGRTLPAGQSLSRKQVVQAVRDSAEAPSARVRQSVLQHVESEPKE